MDVLSLGSENEGATCLFVRVPVDSSGERTAGVLLDCGLDLASLLLYDRADGTGHAMGASQFDGSTSVATAISGTLDPSCGLRLHAPRLAEVAAADVDVVLISNVRGMLALPFLTELSSFAGKIYATEAVRNFGRLALLELADGAAPSGVRAAGGAAPTGADASALSSLFAARNTGDWRRPYSVRAAEAAVERITALRYHERAEVAPRLFASPCAAGIELGAANWLLHTPARRIVYLSASSVAAGRHPAALNALNLMHADVLIATQLAPPPPPAGVYHAGLDELLVGLGTALARGGCVLLPLAAGGVLLDLVEVVASYCAELGASPAMLCVGPRMNDLFGLAETAAEWLSEDKQAQCFVPASAFVFASLLAKKQLSLYDSLAAAVRARVKLNEGPLIVFATHPSLRFGDASALLSLWAPVARNAVILTDTSYDVDALLAPHRPLACSVVRAPLTTRLHVGDAAALIRSLAPGAVVCATRYAAALGAACGDVAVLAYDDDGLRREAVPLTATPELALLETAVQAHLDLADAVPMRGHFVLPVRARLSGAPRHTLDAVYGLSLANATDETGDGLVRPRVVCTLPTLAQLCEAFVARGYLDAVLQSDPVQLVVPALSVSMVFESPNQLAISAASPQAVAVVREVLQGQSGFIELR